MIANILRGLFSVALTLLGLFLYYETFWYALTNADPATGRPAGCWVIMDYVFGYYGVVPWRQIQRYTSLAMVVNPFFFWALPALWRAGKLAHARRRLMSIRRSL
jgi:hypothetical protein